MTILIQNNHYWKCVLNNLTNKAWHTEVPAQVQQAQIFHSLRNDGDAAVCEEIVYKIGDLHWQLLHVWGRLS